VDRALGRATLEFYRATAWRDVPTARLDTLYWMTVNLTRGLAMDAMIGGDPVRRDQILAEWKRIATDMLS
jgi:hypothetical protein